MSIRAQAVAEVLWELKRADKLGTYTLVANRAGFTPGTNGRTIITCLKKIRREWPHLEWWRVIEDNLAIDKNSDQVSALESAGFAMEAATAEDKVVVPAELKEHLVDWVVVDGENNPESSDVESEEPVSS